MEDVRWNHPIVTLVALLFAATLITATTGSNAEGQEQSDGGETSTVVVNKVMEGDGPAEPFVFALICTSNGEPGTDLDLYAPYGGPNQADVLAGEVCTVTEFATQIGEGTQEEDRGPIGTSAVRWSITDGASGTGQETDPFTVSTGETVEITFTNTYIRGSVVVNKVMEGDGPSEPFVFALICTSNGEPGTDLDLYAPYGGPNQADVLAGEVCTVTEFAIQIGEGTQEEDRGPIGTSAVRWSITDGASGTGQETDPFTVSTGETVEITFTNTYPSGETDSDGSVRITKQVDGDAPDAPFEFTIDCDDGFADAFLLRDGESVTFTRASEPYNECTITETNRQGADSSYWKLLLPDGSAVEDDADSPPPVTIVADVTRELTYINGFSSNGDPKPDDETTEAPKEPETTEEPAEQPAETETPTRVEAGTGGQLPSTGLPTQVLALMALGLMLLGIGGLAHTRR